MAAATDQAVSTGVSIYFAVRADDKSKSLEESKAFHSSLINFKQPKHFAFL